MSEDAAKKPATREEIAEYYGNLVGLVLDGDEKKKATYDACATKILTGLHTSFPTLSDTVLGTFAASVSHMFAQAMTVQARDLSEFLTHTFDEYLITAAVLFGGYDVNSPDMPKAPEAKPVAEEPHAAAPVDDYRPGQYL